MNQYPRILNIILKSLLFFGIVFYPDLVFAQAPANDTCSNAAIFTIPQSGFAIGTYDTDSFDLTNATVQVGEYFHTSLVTSGNDKKSIWIKFYIPTRRGLDIELRQNGNAILTNDVGFTTYLSNTCLPGSTAASAAKLTTLNQFGSSFHPCVDPGWYMVQISSKTRANGKVFLRLKTSFPYTHAAVTDAEYDAKDSTYDFGSALVGGGGYKTGYVDFELGCYTVKDSTEFFTPIGNNYKAYNQSAWFTFQAKNNSDAASFQLTFPSGGCTSTDTVGLRLYKGNCKDTAALVLLDSTYKHWGTGGSCYSTCYITLYDALCMLDSGEYYSVQWLFHKDLDKKMRFQIVDYTSVWDSAYNTPIANATQDLGILSGQSFSYYGFSCNSYISNTSCSSNAMPSSGVSTTLSNFNYNLSHWKTFKITELSQLTISVGNPISGAGNSKQRNYTAFRLFKDTITSNCSDIDTSAIILEGLGGYNYSIDCIDSGYYTLQLLGTDSTWDYSIYSCNGPMHLGADYYIIFNQKRLPTKNKFSISNIGDADSVNGLNPLTAYTTVYGERDTISCFDGPQPEFVVDTSLTKKIYRVFNIGSSDSGLLVVASLLTNYTNSPTVWHSNHQLYKGNALSLRSTQSVSQHPDTLAGLTKYKEGWLNRNSRFAACIEPGTYTLVSFFDENVIGQTERPSFTFYNAKTKFNTYSSAEVLDTVNKYQTYYSDKDTFTCTTNTDTIDGYALGVRNNYRVFYLDSVSVVTLSLDYYSRRYGQIFSLFNGDIRNGKSGLTMYNDGSTDWYKKASAANTDCRPMQPGWYTIVCHQNSDIAYSDTSFRYGYNEGYIYTPNQVVISTRKSTVTLPQYNRPYKAAFVDSLLNNNNALAYDTNYSVQTNMPQQLKKYTFPTEVLDCDLDTPIVSFPAAALCDTATTDVIYYVFNLEKASLVRFYAGIPATWKLKMYNFDVRKDSNLLASSTPIQDCNYNPNYVEFCNLKPGVYSIVILCKRTAGQKVTVRPIMYIDSVVHSRFDFAANAYDFGYIPGDGQFYDGKVGDVHPIDSTLPPSHDVIGCFTGSHLGNPSAGGECYVTDNPYVYAGDSNLVLFPNNNIYDTVNSSIYSLYSSSYNIRRNIWYSFVVNGPGKVQVNLNALSHKLLGNPAYSHRFAVYESDVDGSKTLNQLKSSGGLDSTISSGLTLIAQNRPNSYCWYAGSMSVDFEVSICDTFKPRRYYIVLSLSNTNYSMPNINRHAWFEIKYDSVATQLVNSNFNHISNANKLSSFSYDNLLINGGFESTIGWSNFGSYYSNFSQNSVANSGTYSASGASYFNWIFYNDTLLTEQEADLSAFTSNIAQGKASIDFSGYIMSNKTATQIDDGKFILEFKNSSGAVIQTEQSSWISDTSWYNYTLNKSIPTAAKSVNVKLLGRQRSGNTGYNNYYDKVDVFFDDVVLKVVVQDSSLVKIGSNQVYVGEADYFKNAGIDATDSALSSNNSFCADAKSTWYKITVDSVGYIYYNYKYTNYGAYGDLRELTTYNNELYREVSAGDSINGLVHVPYIAGSNAYPSLGYSVYACVSPGTYYIRIIGCNFICNDYAYPQMLFDFHTGDFCETAIPLVIDTLELVKDRALVNCHTMGTDFGEDGSNLGCLYGPNGYKSSWFVVNYEDTAKVDLEFKMAEYTDAKPSDIRYRTYYGNCQSLTPAPCNNNALTSFVLDCVRKGTYYVQIVTPKNATGEVEMSVEAKENTDSTCNPIDIFKPNAAFYYNTNCPENVVEFINTSSRGDSIRYFWDFGYNNLTDTILNPVIAYPPDSKENTYTVKLIVEHITRGSIDSISLPVVVPFAPEVKIITNDTIICSGDSITLNAYISHGNGFWNIGDSSTSIVVNTTGYYYFDMQEKPQLLEASSFEQSNFLNYWTSTGNNWTRTSGYSPIDSSYIVYPTYGSAAAVGIAELYQDYDISFDSIEIDSGISKLSVTGYTRGHLSYATDESQIIVEYYSGSNTLLAQNATGLNKLTNDWDFLNHTRTTPKGTRKVRVRLQVNKTIVKPS
jgi:hypothetical protein